MLMNEYNCNIDIKGRLNFPAKLREELGETFIICKGFGDPCLYAYPLDEWEKKRTLIRSYPINESKQLQRYLFPTATDVTPDKQGRIIIPLKLREHASLTKEVVVVGADDRCEIWDKDAWERVNEEMDDQGIIDILDNMGR